ncbi:MAG TPA: GH92 family glycosyl hydrolase [Tepidisphaeraceae bacterium]|jgi:predicted alpha-1,2-mannosidase|nr:GH92 family glycosyl hydrolase [Tepidisphaeraceae bacterium]
MNPERLLGLIMLFVTIPVHAADVLDSIDPMIGVTGAGSCVPGSCLPNGSIHPSPDTLQPANGGYHRGPNPQIVGFSQLHVQGTGGTKSYGNFLVSPQIGLAIDEASHASPAEDEHAAPDLYFVRLGKYRIRCQVTPTAHAAIYKFTFPKSDDAHLLIDVARKLDKSAALDDGHVSIDPKTGVITGGGQFSGNWNPAPYTLFFAAQVSKAPKSAGTWIDDAIHPNIPDAAAKKQRLGAYLQWNTTDNEVIYLKIAVSFVSEARAAEYLKKEIPEWDFDGVQKQAQSRWRDALSAITIDGASPQEQALFYTALYHTMIPPRDRTGDNPNWQSTDPFFDDHYTLWDTFRTFFPLMAIIRPDFVRDNVNAFIDRHEHNGYVATAFIQGKEYKVGQGGDEIDNVIADAYVKQIPGVDWEKAYALLKYNADHARTDDYRNKGFVSVEGKHDYCSRMKSASGTLAFAYADFSVAQVAKGLGKKDDYEKYLARSANWKNVWDDSLTDAGFSGFPRSRHQDGHFADTPATKGYNTDFYEGTCWIYSYFVPEDVPGMIEKMGGREKFVERLQYALNNNLIDFSNEPSFDTLWWFCAAGRPDLAGFWTNKLKSLYTAQGYPGDEDSGAMSSLYIFLAAGLYPIAGQDIYYVHGPRIPKITFHLPGGKTFTVISQNASPENIYIQSAKLDGKPLDHPWIHHQDITAGGTLEFEMGNKPSNWGQQ